MGDGKWRLFNMAIDPGETRDLAPAEPARQAELIEAWDLYARNVGVLTPETKQLIVERPGAR